MSSVTASMPREWADMSLDPRLLEALRDLRWLRPTSVQRACVPFALKGRDVSMQSRTGSGKTGAFVLPVLQRILQMRAMQANSSSGDGAATTTSATAASMSLHNPVALILVPSVELCAQTVEAAQELAKYVRPRLLIDNLTSGSAAVTAARVRAAHVLVSTAALLAQHVRRGVVTADVLRHVRYMVLDEADMLMRMAELSVQTIQSVLPSTRQTILASATLTDGVAAMRGQLLHNPVNIVLSSSSSSSSKSDAADDTHENDDEGGTSARTTRSQTKHKNDDNDDDNDDVTRDAAAAATTTTAVPVETRVLVRDAQAATLQQRYLVATDECHRHTLLYALYRFALLQGKTLIFVDDEADTYTLQQFLEQLGIATLVYDANLPMNVRLDTLRRFQSGELSTLVCTDGTLDSVEQLQQQLPPPTASDTQQHDDNSNNDAADSSRHSRRRSGSSSTHVTSTRRKRARSSSSNGDDDEAATTPSALHRGIDFSQVRNVILYNGVDAHSSLALLRYTHRVGRAARAGQRGLSIAFFTVPQAKQHLRPLRAYCRGRGESLAPLRALQRSEAAKLQYRVDSVLANITRAATRKLRVATVAAELGRSAYLASHLSQRDVAALQRVVRRSSKAVKVQRAVLDVPEYMQLRGVDDVAAYTQRVRARETRARRFAAALKQQPQRARGGADGSAHAAAAPGAPDALRAAATRLRSAHARHNRKSSSSSSSK